ncbi:MAG: methyltransferase domain-containing protein [Chloroflexi bacterium]|nr:methyltransferase domain-containing protein [Chloroflexota bacterium]
MPGRSQDNVSEFYEFERAGWERVAGDYHRYFAALTTRFIEPLLDAGGVEAGCRVLDVATGPGYVAAAATGRGAQVVGIDFAKAAVDVARQQYPDITFQTASAERLPFPDAQFDAVLMNFGLLHVAQPELAVAEAHRVLRSGGRIAFSVWADPQISLGFQIILDAIGEHGNMDVTLPDGPPFFRFSDPAESRLVLTEAGFSSPRVEEMHTKWDFPHVDTLFDTFLHGAVRTGALLQAQSAEALAAIRQKVRDGVAGFEEDGVYRLPMAAVLSSAKKP